MTERTFYTVKGGRDHVDRLHSILQVAKAGAAASDSVLEIEGIADAHCVLFELIYRLADEALDMAEDAKKAG